jgi:AAHS family 4-hydroxybenzoate transporter-like MFS transporter
VALLAATIACAGLGIIGGQNASHALSSEFYPTRMRSTGVGWALGIGRIGSVVGPIAGGILIAAETSLRDILLICAAAPFIAALALAALRPPSEARAS